jgi:hypothetical protein
MPKQDSESYVIVRGRNVGVHAGYLAEDKTDRMILRDARRLWRWSGALSISELAVLGPANRDGCKFGVPVPRQELRGLDSMGDYEVVHCTEAGREAIQAVAPWRA